MEPTVFMGIYSHMEQEAEARVAFLPVECRRRSRASRATGTDSDSQGAWSSPGSAAGRGKVNFKVAPAPGDTEC